LISLLLAALSLWSVAYSLPDRLLHVRFLNIGQGDAILITTPAGNRILIDGGPSPDTLFSELGRAMPFWDRAIELVVLSHADADHLTGLVPLLERYEVRQVINSAIDDSSPLFARWQELLANGHIPVQRARAGMHIELDTGAHVEVLFPTEASLAALDGDASNSASVVLRLVYGRVSFLFTGDLNETGERALLQTMPDLASTVLKVSHHGASGATTAPFLQAVRPELSVISVGPNRFGHPARETLARLGDVPVLRTDRSGTIDMASDGTQCWVKTGPR
jgi:competence protein ComEC